MFMKWLVLCLNRSLSKPDMRTEHSHRNSGLPGKTWAMLKIWLHVEMFWSIFGVSFLIMSAIMASYWWMKIFAYCKLVDLITPSCLNGIFQCMRWEVYYREVGVRRLSWYNSQSKSLNCLLWADLFWRRSFLEAFPDDIICSNLVMNDWWIEYTIHPHLTRLEVLTL
jgi:hypothetical protein